MNLTTLRRKYRALRPVLTERSRRVWAASEAVACGHGGIGLVERATGISRSTISRGIRELDVGAPLAGERTRRPGGGRKRAADTDASLVADLDALVEPTASGDPDSPLRWTSKSVRHLATELQAIGHAVSYRLVATLLHAAGYSLQANRKTREGPQHPDRDAQFRYLAAQVRRFQRQHRPAISVDTKKKELVGDFRNAGREWRPQDRPEKVRVHDFLIKGQGKAVPYGVYDLARKEGWVSVGIDPDTASFAVHAIRRWWNRMGRSAYPDTPALLITADAGGSNGSRVRLWKWELQQFANRTGLTITVCHFPPGTSKWNRIEHRLFSHIAMNWRGKPLVDLVTIVNLIGETTTDLGLRVRAEVDPGRYPMGVVISDAQMAQIQLEPHAFHGDWNYSIRPRARRT
ncbi:MAG: ISAzo13 family transposase [Gemmatimonadaceae bacterium]